jgi:hypothetical protein
MSGVYGDFIEVFPELRESFEAWDKEDASDKRQVIAVYMPNEGGGIKRRKYTSGNTGLDITNSDEFYIDNINGVKVKVGTYIRQLSAPQYVLRLTHDVGYDKAAGYHIYVIERVTGANIDKTEDLKVKEGYFA